MPTIFLSMLWLSTMISWLLIKLLVAAVRFTFNIGILIALRIHQLADSPENNSPARIAKVSKASAG